MSTSEAEPLAPAEVSEEYTGSWSDWIKAGGDARAPSGSAPAYGDSEFDDEYYDDEDDYGHGTGAHGASYEPAWGESEYEEPEFESGHGPGVDRRAEDEETFDGLVPTRRHRTAQAPAGSAADRTGDRGQRRTGADGQGRVEVAARRHTDSTAPQRLGSPAQQRLAAQRRLAPAARHRRGGGTQQYSATTRERFGDGLRRLGSSSPESDGEKAWLAPLLGVLAVLAVTAAVGVQIAKSGSSDTAQRAPGVATPPPASTTAQPAAAAPAELCPNEASGASLRGNGPGGTTSGPNAILALQNRYYVDRSGQAVREMFAPDAAAPTAAQIQAGIDTVPAGTTYCVQIAPGPFDGQHIMVVSETHPDASRKTWPAQLVITTVSGDRTLISAIVPASDESAPPR
ncbi:hypothetical protein [Nocardia jejuensis]|uniref:hypothetical protein n=1 Tax=Nocardia jejuensis TaxID=328049 RepID=UPI00083337A5|nr:hypothetical protein [Nocardia jejuensis]